MRVDFELLDGVHDRRNGVGADELALVVDPVEHEEVAAVVLAVDGRKLKLANGPGAESARVLRDAYRRHSRRQCQQLGEVAPVQGQIDHLPFGDGRAQLGGRGLQFRAGSLDSDRFGDGADFQRKVEGRLLAHVQREGLNNGCVESFLAGLQRVRSRLQVRKSVVAYRVRGAV